MSERGQFDLGSSSVMPSARNGKKRSIDPSPSPTLCYGVTVVGCASTGRAKEKGPDLRPSDWRTPPGAAPARTRINLVNTCCGMRGFDYEHIADP